MFFFETWLRPYSTLESHFRIDNYKIFCRDRLGRSGGGLLVYSKNSLDTRRRHDLEDDRIECLTVELSTKRTTTNDKCLFFCCYRPPDQSVDIFFDTLADLLYTAEAEGAITFVLGDFNAKHSSWDPVAGPNAAGTRLFRLLLDFSLVQCVQTPTRASADGDSFSTILLT